MGRKLELKTIPFGDGSKSLDGTAQTLDYRDQLLQVLRAPKDSRIGVTYAEMEVRLPLLGKVKAAGKYVLLTDAEWREVRDAFKAFKFIRVIEAVHQMGKDIDAAETVKLEEVEAKASA